MLHLNAGKAEINWCAACGHFEDRDLKSSWRQIGNGRFSPRARSNAELACNCDFDPPAVATVTTTDVLLENLLIDGIAHALIH